VWRNHRLSRRRRPPYRPPRRGAVRLTPTALAEIERLVYGDHTGLPFSAGVVTVPKVTSVFGRTGVVVGTATDYASVSGFEIISLATSPSNTVGTVKTTFPPLVITATVTYVHHWQNLTGINQRVLITAIYWPTKKGIGKAARVRAYLCNTLLNLFTAAQQVIPNNQVATLGTAINSQLSQPFSLVMAPGEYLGLTYLNARISGAKTKPL
jgi:hypothetical protein